jgi:phosphoglycolate phosphatase
LTPPTRGPTAPPKRRFRVLVTDVDGTLTDSSRRLDPAAIAAIRSVEDRGIPVILATGNVLPIALALHRSLGLTGPIVAENGGILWSQGAHGEDRVERLADLAVARSAYRALGRAGIPTRPLFTNRWRESEVAIEPTVSLARVRKALAGRPVRVEGTGFAIHLMQTGAGKRPALDRVFARMGVRWPEVVVLGDGDNDVEMLRAAGWSGSFPTGSPRARAAAQYVSGTEYAEGFVEGLKASGVLD